jgi:hypothetical protein
MTLKAHASSELKIYSSLMPELVKQHPAAEAQRRALRVTGHIPYTSDEVRRA